MSSRIASLRVAFTTLENTFTPDFFKELDAQIEESPNELEAVSDKVRHIAGDLTQRFEDLRKLKKRKVGDDGDSDARITHLISIELLGKQINASGFKDFYTQLKTKIKTGQIVGDYSNALEALLKANLKELGKLGKGENKLSFLSDATLSLDPSWAATRAIRGFFNSIVHYTADDDDISNLTVFAEFIQTYYQSRTVVNLDQQLVDLFSDSIAGLEKLKTAQYADTPESKANELRHTEGSLRKLTATREHIRSTVPLSNVEQFLIHLVKAVAVDGTLPDDKSKVYWLAFRLKDNLGSIFSTHDFSEVGLLLSKNQGLCKHQSLLAASILFKFYNDTHFRDSIRTFCKELIDEREKYLKTIGLVDSDFEKLDYDLFKGRKLDTFCVIVDETKQNEQKIKTAVEKEEIDKTYEMIKLALQTSSGGILVLIPCLLGPEKTPDTLKALMPQGLSFASTGLDTLLDVALKTTIFDHEKLPLLKSAINKFRQDFLKNNPQQSLEKLLELFDLQLKDANTIIENKDKIIASLKKMIEEHKK